MTRKELWVFEKVELVNAHKILRLEALIGSQLWWVLGSFPANYWVADFFFFAEIVFILGISSAFLQSLESRWKSILFGQLSTYLFVKQPLEKTKKKKRKEIQQLNDLAFQHLVLLILSPSCPSSNTDWLIVLPLHESPCESDFPLWISFTSNVKYKSFLGHVDALCKPL